MKKDEIQVGQAYRANVSGRITTVRVDAIRTVEGYRPRNPAYGQKKSPDRTAFECTNLTTGRAVVFKSAMKFQRQVDQSVVATPVVEGEQGSDPTQSVVKSMFEDTATNSRSSVSVMIRSSSEEGTSSSTLENLPLSTDSLASRLRSNIVRPVGSGLTPTAEQEEILAAVQRDDHVIVVEAGAGTGKTSTLKMIGQCLPGNGQYTAFNSSLVAESKTKFAGSTVTCNTTHSLAFRAEGVRFSHRLGGNRVRGDQLAQMLGISAMEVPFGTVSKRLAAGFLASQVMGAIRRFCQSADPEVTADHFKYIDGIDMPSDEGRRGYASNGLVRDYLLPFARKAWKDLSDPDGQLPFSHECYVKVWQLGNPVISCDYLLIDEAQDLSPNFLDVIQRQKCKVILVGDSAQQIYEWRGAVNAMAHFSDAPRCYLSQSFRFGQAIADVANAVLATLEEPTKLRLKGSDRINSTVEKIENPTAILTRTNAVAVASLFGAIADSKRPFLIGGGGDTIAFVEAAQKLQTGELTSHPDLCCFGSWGEVQEYVKMEEGQDLQLMVKIIDSFGATTILAALRSMPAKEEDADLVISTAHKSKGREWDRVKLAADFPTKSKCCDSDRKLLYVALTRAKLQLDVTSCPFFTGEDSLDIKSIRDRYHSSAQVQSSQGVVPEAPSAPPAPTQFTWSSKDGKWFVRGMKGQVGKEVSVVRKDGSSQKKKLIAVVQDFESSTLYKV